jgi:hypothetical protein
MFTRVVALATAASLFAFAAAAPGGSPANSQCNGGQIHCCNQTQDAKHLDQKTSLLLQLLQIDASTLTGVVGTTCSPISALSIGGNSWYLQHFLWIGRWWKLT